MLQISPAPFRSILIIQTKFVGDIVLASTLARNLRLEFPDSRIVFLCEAHFESFVVAHGIASEVVAFRRASMRGTLLQRAKELYAVVRALRGFRFDLTIDLTDSKTSRLVSGLVNARTRVGYNPSERPLKLLERQPANVFAKPFGFGGQHFVYRYLSPLEALGIDLHATVPSIKPLPFEAEKALALLGRHHIHPNAFIAVHAGASFKGRQWQPERFAEAIDEIAAETGLGVVLVGGPDERETAARIVAGTATQVVDLVGELSLESLLAVLEQARMFLGNESGPMHMAAAAGTPVVGLFGLTNPSRWGPVGVPSIALRPSMPCDCVAKDLCRRTDPSKACCVWRLEVKPVVEAAREVLARTEMKQERAV
ncbi:MAG: glycosyltransferase family 9 protein [Mesorhizobium sp.]|uniref:glycosyltransferase family 9 protein n=1 Tax=unclassified Mesorhizobium TaxID=325217 RepID=UPI000FCA728A|nr:MULTISPECIES: glycosyltransferase family 9 protein [unclassified Mesorhizobium]RUX00093.1 glycosyltransferase family 9 protein [Mesorhizobium sp. M8A.F.Ca.ET.023.01.1.1]RUW55906.1 glycosyltransferase family 9 protein [Mesorhizobium sp. M8A.F.Ca.ET.021.01.1.1]RWC76576.1 MAG: glycosyltransferase family 9 protein [Mesorhizobium sp.]RWF38972.1 MAG: glycosyltransferase family 9 protein [Mesorhizobium sp.]TGS43204.1 glycosyltransferase family 9 protein [Mesorhizobium sp. M8A.F.Ca.ET.182.01.1.1]